MATETSETPKYDNRLTNILWWYELYAEVEKPDRRPEVPVEHRELDSFTAVMDDQRNIILTPIGEEPVEDYLAILEKHYGLSATIRREPVPVIKIPAEGQPDLEGSLQKLASTVMVRKLMLEMRVVDLSIDKIFEAYEGLGHKKSPETLALIEQRIHGALYMRREQFISDRVKAAKAQESSAATTADVEMSARVAEHGIGEESTRAAHVGTTSIPDTTTNVGGGAQLGDRVADHGVGEEHHK